MQYYDALMLMGMKPGFNEEELRLKWRYLAKIYHPDVSRSIDGAEKFKTIKTAYDVLSDSIKYYGSNQAHFDQASRQAYESAQQYSSYQSTQTKASNLNGGYVSFSIMGVTVLGLCVILNLKPEGYMLFYDLQTHVAYLVSSTITCLLPAKLGQSRPL